MTINDSTPFYSFSLEEHLSFALDSLTNAHNKLEEEEEEEEEDREELKKQVKQLVYYT